MADVGITSFVSRLLTRLLYATDINFRTKRKRSAEESTTFKSDRDPDGFLRRARGRALPWTVCWLPIVILVSSRYLLFASGPRRLDTVRSTRQHGHAPKVTSTVAAASKKIRIREC